MFSIPNDEATMKNEILENILLHWGLKKSPVVLFRNRALETNSSSAHSLTFNPDLNFSQAPVPTEELVLHLRPTARGNFRYHLQSLQDKLSYILLNQVGLFGRSGSKFLGAGLLEQAHEFLGFSRVTLCTDVEVDLEEAKTDTQMDGVITLSTWTKPEDGWNFDKLFADIDHITGKGFINLDTHPYHFASKDWLYQAKILHDTGGAVPMFSQKMVLDYPASHLDTDSNLDSLIFVFKDELKKRLPDYSDEQLELMIFTEIMLNPALIIHRYWDEDDEHLQLGFHKMQDYLFNNDYLSPLGDSQNRVYVGIAAALWHFAGEDAEDIARTLGIGNPENRKTVDLNERYRLYSCMSVFHPEIFIYSGSHVRELAEIIHPYILENPYYQDVIKLSAAFVLLHKKKALDKQGFPFNAEYFEMDGESFTKALNSKGEERKLLKNRVQAKIEDLLRCELAEEMSLTQAETLAMLVDWASSDSLEEMLAKVRYHHRIIGKEQGTEFYAQYAKTLKRLYKCLKQHAPVWVRCMDARHVRPDSPIKI